MAGRLTFKIDDAFKALVSHARSAKEHRPTYDQLFDEDLLKDGCEAGEHDCADLTKVPPGLLLVKDQGVYLMSNGISDSADADKKSNPVVYAHQCDPKLNPQNYYDVAREIAGGDDFVEFIDIEVFESAIHDGAETLLIDMNENSMEVAILLPRQTAK